MPFHVDQSLRDQGFLRSRGPHAPDTVRRRLASWSTLTRWRGLDGAFASPALKSAIRLAVRATPRPRKRKSAKAVTGDILVRMLATCPGDSLRDLRDRAVLMVGFASGGRRRSEIAGLRVEQLAAEEPVPGADGNPSPPSPFTLAGQRPLVPITTRSSISPAGRSMPSTPGCKPRRSTRAASSGRSIAGATCPGARLTRSR